jgi:hypothetical protein
MSVSLRNSIRSLERASGPSTPAAGVRLLYPKSDGWYGKDSAGVETKLSGTMSAADITALAAATPAGGLEIPVNDSGTTKKLTLTQVNAYCEPVSTASVATQTPAANTDVYITDSAIPITPSRLQARTYIRWFLHISKTAASTAAPVFVVRHGTAASTADAARCTLTMGAQTAVANAGAYLVLTATFRSVGAASAAVLQAGVNGVGNGFPPVGAAATSAGFDSTTANAKIGLSVNTGLSAAWTITQVLVDILNVT